MDFLNIITHVRSIEVECWLHLWKCCQNLGDVLHHLFLSHASFSFHRISAILVGVLDIGESKRSSTIDIASELRDSSFSVVCRIKFDNTCTTGTSIGLVLDFSSFNFSDCRKEFDKVIVAGGPWELYLVSKFDPNSME